MAKTIWFVENGVDNCLESTGYFTFEHNRARCRACALATERHKAQGFEKSTDYRRMMGGLPNSDYNQENDRPKAYMVWMLFDKQMKLVKSGRSSGARQIPEGAGQVKQMAETGIVMDQGGFFSAYTVNESPSSVYIDNFQLTTFTGSVLEENNYYPFGMINNGLSVDGTMDSKNYYKYNGKELQKELSLEWLDYGARFYDPQIGRWHSVDPMAEKYRKWTPYNYCVDNPIGITDPDGMDPILEGIKIHQNYGVMVVLPNSYINDRAMMKDHAAAKKAGIPVMLVDNIKDFATGMDQLKEKGITVNTYFVSQHGAPGDGAIGDERISAKTDFSSLKDGLNGKNIFLSQCDLTKDGKGDQLIKNFSNQTNTNVAAADHKMVSGNITDTPLNDSGWLYDLFIHDGANSNDFRIAEPSKPVKSIFDLILRNNGTLVWNVYDNKK